MYDENQIPDEYLVNLISGWIENTGVILIIGS